MDASRFAPRIGDFGEGGDALQLLALNLAKRFFHIYGVDNDGKVVSRRVGRSKLTVLVGRPEPEFLAMEACATAHHWARTSWPRDEPYG